MIKSIRIFGAWLVCGKRFYLKKDAENYINDNYIQVTSIKEAKQILKRLYKVVSSCEKRGYIMDLYKREIFNAVYWLKYWNFDTKLYYRIDKLLKGKWKINLQSITNYQL